MRDGTAYLRSNGTGHEGGSIEVRTERAMPFAAAGALAPTRGREKKDLEEYIENQEEPWDHLSSSTAWQQAGQFLMTTFEGGDVPRMSAILRIGQERRTLRG